MYTDPSLTVISREPAFEPGMRRFSSTLMKGVPALLAVVLLSFGTGAYAGDGPYVGIGGGLSMLNDNSVRAPSSETYPALNATATTDDGFAIRAMAGYAFPNGFRVEAEVDYRQHKTNQMDVKSPGSLVELAAPSVAAGVNALAGSAIYADPANTSYTDLIDAHKAGAAAAVTGEPQAIVGDFSMLAFMANVDYDFDTGSRWVPYVGGGLGVATISVDTETDTGTPTADSSDIVFAYQVGAGLGYEFPLEAGRSITVSLDWRYFATQDPTFTGRVTGGQFDVGISGHDIGIGIIYGF